MKKRRARKFLSVLLSLAMVLSLMPGMALTAYADPDPDPTGPVIIAQTETIDAEYQADVGQADRTLSVTATGTGTLTYEWYVYSDYYSELTVIPGATESTYVLDEDFTSTLGLTMYCCKVTDDNGTISSEQIDVFVLKTVGIQWSTDRTFEYDGTEQAPEAWATGLLEGDECEVVVSGEIDAGEDLVATVRFITNGKYRLPTDDLTCTFTIQPMEVTFVWDDTDELQYNGRPQPEVEVADLVYGDDCRVTLSGQSTRPTNGETRTATVTGLTGADAGNYKWTPGDAPVTIDYSIVNRPVAVTARPQVVEDGKPIIVGPDAVTANSLGEGDRIVSVTVEADEDTGTITVSDPVIMNSNNEDVTGYYDITCKPGRFKVVTADPRLEMLGRVEIPIDQYNGDPVSGATVLLQKGNVIYGSTVTDANGDFSFTSVEEGWYNLVVIKDDRISTVAIYHSYEGIQGINVITMLPEGRQCILDNSAAGDLGAVLVWANSSVADRYLENAPGSVRFTVTSEENEDELSRIKREEFQEGKMAIADLPEADGMELEFFDMSLSRTVGGVTMDIGRWNPFLFLVMIPYDTRGKNIAVFRYHDDTAEMLTLSDSTYMEGFEYDDDYILIRSSGFSTFAIGYEAESNNNENVGGGRTSGGDDRGGSMEPEPQTQEPVTQEPTRTGAPETPTVEFADLKPGWYYNEPVKWAVERGIAKGKTATIFAPDDSCTRGEMVTFLWRASGSPDPLNTAQTFKDVKPGAYYEKAVSWAVEQGVTNGTGAGAFSPGEIVKRDEAVTLLYRAMNGAAQIASAKVTAQEGELAFSDVKEGEFYTDAVNWVLEKGISLGTAPGTFSPEQECCRGQVVTFLYRAYKESV